MKRYMIGSGVFLALMIAFCVRTYLGFHAGEQEMIALLSGDPKVEMTSFVTEHQQRRLECTDRQVLDYLCRAARKQPAPNIGLGGLMYHGYFKFRDGGSFDGEMCMSTNAFELLMPSRESVEGYRTRVVMLVEPVPEKVKQVFEFFQEPWQTTAGTVLVLEDGKPPRRERDESLIRQ